MDGWVGRWSVSTLVSLRHSNTPTGSFIRGAAPTHPPTHPSLDGGRSHLDPPRLTPDDVLRPWEKELAAAKAAAKARKAGKAAGAGAGAGNEQQPTK